MDEKTAKQAYKVSLEYYIELHGEEEGRERIREMKSRDLNFFVRKYGDEEGDRKMYTLFDIDDEIVEIEYIGEEETLDIDVSGDHLFYANNILTHNSAVDESDHSQSMIAGGISKIQTADNVISIYASQGMRERGEFQCQFLKTRSSSGVGSKIYLGFDITSLRIFNLGEGYELEEAESKPTLRDKLGKEEILRKAKRKDGQPDTGITKIPEQQAEPTSKVDAEAEESESESKESPLDRLRRLQQSNKI